MSSCTMEIHRGCWWNEIILIKNEIILLSNIQIWNLILKMYTSIFLKMWHLKYNDTFIYVCLCCNNPAECWWKKIRYHACGDVALFSKMKMHAYNYNVHKQKLLIASCALTSKMNYGAKLNHNHTMAQLHHCIHFGKWYAPPIGTTATISTFMLNTSDWWRLDR